MAAFDPRASRGESSSLPGEIDYRLNRRSIVASFRKGRLARHEVCDAHPDLMRAARNGVGEDSSEPCPICEEGNVVLVSYVFGPGMPAQGKCIASKAELNKLRRGAVGDLACYVVEVCPRCSWNHLARTFLVTPTRATSRTAPGP